MESNEKNTNKGTMMISYHDITFPDDNLVFHKLEDLYKDKEWNTFLKDSILNHKWLSLYHDPNTDAILSDQVVPNLYGLNINNSPSLDPQATDSPNPIEEYLKCKKDI